MKTSFLYINLVMKKLFLAIIWVVGVLISCTDPHKDRYSRLDLAIALQEQYDMEFSQKTDSIATVFQRAETDSIKWESAFLLEKMFFYHDLDSCKHYINAMFELCGNDIRQRATSECCNIYYLYKSGERNTARTYYERLDTSGMDAECLNIFYDVGYHIYRDLAASDKTYEDLKQQTLDSWWQYDSTNVRCAYYNNEALRTSGRSAEAIERLKRCRIVTLNDTALFHDYLAREQLFCGDTENAIDNLAIAAECDMRLSAKTYNALYMLAKISLQKGDTERASRYLRTTKEDALSAKLKHRHEQVLLTEMEMMELLVKQHKQKQTAYLFSTIITALLLLIAIILLGLLSRSSTRLMASKEKYQEVSKIKDKFLGIYMERCVEYLNKVDEHRSYLRHTLKHEGVNAVAALLRQQSFTYGEFKMLLSDFDSAFLGIFPDFADKVNEHMKEGHHLQMPSDGVLSTELRILALIRMGISKRSRIAKVLNMSVTTVYSYHSNLQKHSLHHDGSFDDVIANL